MCRHRAIRSVLVIDCQYTSESAIYRTYRFVILKRLYATTLVVSDACLATVTRNLCRTVRGITTECSHRPTRHGILRRCDVAACVVRVGPVFSFNTVLDDSGGQKTACFIVARADRHLTTRPDRLQPLFACQISRFLLCVARDVASRVINKRADFARCSDEMRTQRTVIVVLNRRYRLLPGDCRNGLRRPVGAVPRVLRISFGGYSLLQIPCCIPRARSRTP